MKIEVNLYAILSTYKPDHAGANSWIVECDEGTSLAEFIKQLDVPLKEVKIIFVNGVHASEDDVLKEGDRVGVFPPVGGG